MLGKIFGSDKVVSKSLDLIDDIWMSDEEEFEEKRKTIAAKTKAKTDLLDAYSAFRLAQRYIAFAFTLVFVFIMINGVVGSLYGLVDMDAVDNAREFADSMWLGEIMLAIVSFYFGGGLMESVKRKGKNHE